MMDNKSNIPKVYFNTVEDQPFSNCSKCDISLLENNINYVIEKIYIPKDILFEYAMCEKCIDKAQSQMSKESREKLENFSEEILIGHMQIIDDFVDEDIDTIISHCNKENPKEDFSRGIILGYFEGKNVQSDMHMICISASIAEKIQELYSEETRNDLDDFMDFVNNVPPGLEKLFDKPKPILI